jgi:hypothetical protein
MKNSTIPTLQCLLVLLAASGFAATAACPQPSGDDDDDDSGDGDDDSGAGGDDDDATTPPDDDDATTPVDDDDSSPPPDDDDSSPPPDDDDSTGAGTAPVTGNVTRSAEIQVDGVGDIYVAVFETNPMDQGNPPVPVASAFLPAADMIAADASIAYQVDVVPKAEPYYIFAFFDDNGTASPATPGPDNGDLMTMEGFSSPTVTVPDSTGATKDLDLNFVMAF